MFFNVSPPPQSSYTYAERKLSWEWKREVVAKKKKGCLQFLYSKSLGLLFKLLFCKKSGRKWLVFINCIYVFGLCFWIICASLSLFLDISILIFKEKTTRDHHKVFNIMYSKQEPVCIFWCVCCFKNIFAGHNNTIIKY